LNGLQKENRGTGNTNKVRAFVGVLQAAVYPVTELVYQGDLSNCYSLLLVPGIASAFSRHFELKAGTRTIPDHAGRF
jgi:hypothetical protein